jgi:hypothetical protein
MKKRISSYYTIQICENRYVKSYKSDKGEIIEIEITPEEKDAKHFHIITGITPEELLMNKITNLFKDAKTIHYELFKDEN